MGRVRRWVRRLGILARKGRVERELDEELRFHIEMETRELMGRGVPEAEARSRALRAFGGVERHKEDARDAMGVRVIEELLKDLRFALRNLRRRPIFTAVVLLTLAVGVGASAAIFGFVDGVLLKPLPYPEPDRVVRIRHFWTEKHDGGVSPAEHLDYERQLAGFSAYGSYTFGALSLGGDADPERVVSAFVSHGALPALGVAPSIGRHIDEEEDRSGAAVALLSHGLWQRRYGGDPSVVGRSLVVNDTTVAVVGVLPADFELPDALISGTSAELYLPLGIDPGVVQNRGSHFLEGVGRLRPGVSQGQAAREVERVTARWVSEFVDDYPRGMEFGGTAEPIYDYVLGDVRPLLLTLLAASVLLLIIVTANVTSLNFAAIESRRLELAVRGALGAGRRRIVRLLLVESLVLALVGGALGVLVAAAGTDLILALDPPNIPRFADVRLSGAGLGFALGISVLAGVGYGLLPALRVVRRDPSRALGRGVRGATSRSGLRVRRALVVGELTLAIVVLSGAGLFARSFAELLRVDPGFRAEGVLTGRINLPGSRYAEDEQVTSFIRQLTDRLAGLPGVTAAGAVTNLPLATTLGDLNFEIEGRPLASDERSPASDWQTVTPGYLGAMGLSMTRGRWIEPSDNETATGVVVVSETMAARHWPDEDPIGQRILLGGGAGPGWVTVVGIVRDVTHAGLDAEGRPQMYLPHAQFRYWGSGQPVTGVNLVLRTDGDPLDYAGALRETLRGLDPRLPISNLTTMEEVLSQSVSQPRAMAVLLGLFSGVALLLAVIGVYGIMAYSVGERRREFAIRMAIGAQDRQVVRAVVGQGASLVTVGVFLGLLLALLLSRGVSSLLFRVSPADPVTLVLVAFGLGAVGLLACWIPANQATRVQPVTALRAE